MSTKTELDCLVTGYMKTTHCPHTVNQIIIDFLGNELMKQQKMPQEIRRSVGDLYSNDPVTQFKSIQRINRLLSVEKDRWIEFVIDSGIIPQLIELLQFEKSDGLQYEIVWCLTNITATSSSENIRIIIEYGAIRIFIKLLLLKSESNKIQKQVIWALGNIAGDNIKNRDLVLSHDILTKLLAIFNINKDLNLLRMTTRTLSNFCRGQTSPNLKYIELLIKALMIMIESNDIEILENVCCSFNYLSNTDNQEQIGMIIENQHLLHRFIKLLDDKNPNIRHSSLRIIGNIIAGSDHQYTQKVINCGILPKLYDLIQKEDVNRIKRDGCWTISNITAGSIQFIEAVRRENLFKPLMDILNNEKLFEISKEALRAISNAISGGNHIQIAFLVNQGVIHSLCKYLGTKILMPPKIILVALKVIENILSSGEKLRGNGVNKYSQYIKENGGVQILKEIQSNQSDSNEIYKKTEEIIKVYFNGKKSQKTISAQKQQQKVYKNNDNNILQSKFEKNINNKTQQKHEINKSNKSAQENKMLQQIVKGCNSNDRDTQFKSIQSIRKLLSISRDPPIQTVIDSGILPRFIEFLQFEDDEELQIEAAWCLNNIAAGTSQNTAAVIRYGAIPIFVKLIECKSYELKEQVIWALGNIAGDSSECRDLVLSHNALNNLLPVFNINCKNNKEELNLSRAVTRTLCNFCRCQPSANWKYVSLIIGALIIMIDSDDTEILQDACWAFSYLSHIESQENEENGDQQIRIIMNSGCLDRLIYLLDHEMAHIRLPALRSIGNIVAECDQYTEMVLNCGVLKKLHYLIQHDIARIKREACWTVSNITAGSKHQIEAVIACNLFQALIDILRNEKYEISKEALWAISNATSGGTDKQIAFLVNQGVIHPFCQFFKQKMAPRTMLVALEGMENILAVGHRIGGNNGCNQFAQYIEESGGIQYLKEIGLNETIPEQIYDRAAGIIKQYFNKKKKMKKKNNSAVPRNYFCYQCKTMGDHWVMQCPMGYTVNKK